MTYEQAVDWLYAQLPNYQNDGPAALNKKLDNVRALSRLFGSPEESLKLIHVAGTNGKGTTCHLLSSIYQEAGYRVGLYTSPHLHHFSERIRINGEPISEDAIVAFVQQFQALNTNVAPSFFEMTVIMAFKYFQEQQVDLAIIETGLGGRFDATNIITPLISVITNVSLDHQDTLGDTVVKIAGEKAGIMKPNVPVIIGELQEELIPVWERQAEGVGTSWNFAHSWNDGIEENTIEKKNISIVNAVVASLAQFKVSHHQFHKGIERVNWNTGLRGRWQVVEQEPLIVADVAHNEAGVEALVDRIASVDYDKLYVLWGMVNDKDHSSILRLLPQEAHYFFVKPSNPRGMEAETLEKLAQGSGLKGEVVSSVDVGVHMARSRMAPNDLLIIGGSNFTVADFSLI